MNFFNPLKLAYHQLVDNYQLGSDKSRANKAFFYPWFQKAWDGTTNSRIIRSAWRKSGLYPLDQSTMRANCTPPPPSTAQSLPETPHNQRTSQILDRSVRRGEISPHTAYEKLSRANDRLIAKNVLLEMGNEKRQRAAEMDKATGGGQKRTRFHQGFCFDHTYRETHAAELAARKEKERAAGERRLALALAKRNLGRPNLVSPQAGPSTRPVPSFRPLQSVVVEIG